MNSKLEDEMVVKSEKADKSKEDVVEPEKAEKDSATRELTRPELEALRQQLQRKFHG